MNKTPLNKLSFIPAALCLLFCLLAHNVGAAVLYWNPNGTDSVAGDGTWDNTTLQWSPNLQGEQTNLSALVAWIPTDAACFCAGPPPGSTSSGPVNVTVLTNITCAGFFNGDLNPDSCILTLTNGGALNGEIILESGNANAMEDGGSVLGSTTVALPLTGSATASLVLELSGQVYLNCSNSYAGGTYLGYQSSGFSGIVNIGNPYCFGAGPLIISNCYGCAIALEDPVNPVTVPNSVLYTNKFTTKPTLDVMSVNIVGNPAGLTFTGTWNLGTSNNLSLGSGGSAGNLVVISGVISGTASSLSIFNPGDFELKGVNTYTGNTTNTSTGTFYIAGAGSLGNGTYAGLFDNEGAFVYN